MLKNTFFIITALIVSLIGSIFGLKDAKAPEAKIYPITASGTTQVREGVVAVHDPSVIKSEDGRYYIFGTHMCAAESDDMINWYNTANGIGDNNPLFAKDGAALRESLSEPFEWTDAYQALNGYDENQWQTNIWASDVIYNSTMDKYCYYGSSSVWGTAASVIWLATSDNIEGPYEYSEAFLYSGFNNRTQYKQYIRSDSMHWSFTNLGELMKKGVFSADELQSSPWYNADGSYNSAVYPNCIDPALFYDKDGNMWLSYGSYFGGTYILPLDESTGLPDYDYMKQSSDYDNYFGKKIVSTNAANDFSGEGVFITYDSVSGYYYLYISYGGLSALGGYNIREYRSESPDGPYYDAAGNKATDDKNTGVKLMGAYKFSCNPIANLASGHSSCLADDNGKLFQVYHTRFNSGHDGYETRVHQMLRTKDGWAAMLPFEYNGETADKSYTAENITGSYEFIAHGTDTVTTYSWDRVNDIISPTQIITLNADGTISGLYRYGSDRNDATVSKKKVQGSWVLTDSKYITINYGGISYSGVLCEQTDESGTLRTVFTAIGENNESLWGAKIR